VELIGRRLLIYWGNKVIAIEKLVIAPEELGLSQDNPCKLQDIVRVLDEVQFRDAGEPEHNVYGRTADGYITDGRCWITKAEQQSLQRQIELEKKAPIPPFDS
jgi:hypothetical protein